MVIGQYMSPLEESLICKIVEYKIVDYSFKDFTKNWI